MRVLVCGDRDWSEYSLIRDRISKLPPGSVVIHGGCRGADTMAGIAAQAFGFAVIEYKANWEDYGPRAGPVRNQLMLDYGKPDLVIAFHHDLVKSCGTRDMVTRARKARLPVEVLP